MNEPFSTQLFRLRKNAKLTNAQLAERAEVPESLISGLQCATRRVGELQARRIGNALGLLGEPLEAFVLNAIDTCSEKVLKEALPYPAQLLNLLAVQLNRAGIIPESISGMTIAGDLHEQDITFTLRNGKQATLRTQLTLN